jgi:hypothetical protein
LRLSLSLSRELKKAYFCYILDSVHFQFPIELQYMVWKMIGLSTLQASHSFNEDE